MEHAARSRLCVFTITTLDEEATEVEHQLPARYVVCQRCNGTGHHDHPAFSNGITSDEWHGPDWDDDSRDGYLRGDYDVPCTECHGERVVLHADETRMTPAQLALWRQYVVENEAAAAERAHEIRMGY